MDEESYEWNNSQADQYEQFWTVNTKDPIDPGLRTEAARFKPTPKNDMKCYQWTLFLAGSAPLYIITVIANIVVLFVWNAEPKHHTTTYVFKMLATTDVLHCLGFLIWRPIDVFTSVYPQWLRPSMLPHPIPMGSTKANVYTSLLLALIRLVKVTPGLSAERIFSRARLRAICAFICTWTFFLGAFSCFLASPPNVTCMEALRRIGDTVTADRLRIVETVMNDHVGFSIPAFLQMIVMIRVMWQVRKYFKERGGMSEELAKTIRRLDYTVFCICSFTTHGISRVIATVMKARSTTWTFELTILHSIITLFVGFNGLINVAFYAIFVPRFRELVRKRLNCMVEFVALDTRSIFPGQTTTVNADPGGPTFTSKVHVEGDTTRTRKATSGRTFQTTTATEGRSLETTTMES